MSTSFQENAPRQPDPKSAGPRPVPAAGKVPRTWLAVFAGSMIGLAGVAYSQGWYGKIFAEQRVDLGPVRVFDTPAPGSAPEGMVWVPGGVFWMGLGEREFQRGH